MEALTPKGFALLSDEEMFAVDGGGVVTEVFDGIVAVVEAVTILGVQAFAAVLTGIVTVANLFAGLFGR
ncbi:MAG: hypothetical protein LBK75_00970 [Oscillospiraceae bacterium]|nr:hypothetical protein [Oscillospiraceae bacterium]